MNIDDRKSNREHLGECSPNYEHWLTQSQSNAHGRWLVCCNCGLRLFESMTRSPVRPGARIGIRANANKAAQ